MNVNTIQASVAFAYTKGTQGVRNADGVEKKQDAAKKGIGEAYELDLSQGSKEAQQKGAVSAVTQNEGSLEGGNAEKLSADQVQALKDEVDQSYSMMIQSMTEQNMKIQNLFNEGIYDFAFNDGLFSLSNLVLPPVGTTPEEAKAAISEGGNYSVKAVADRIWGLAEALAGGDSGVLSEMRDAVEKGFNLAGASFKEMTGKEDMPQITKDTYKEIMDRFDKKAAELGGVNDDNEALA